MTRILGVDTATEACTVGLWIEGGVQVRHAVTPRGHADRVLDDCRVLLAQSGLRLADLDALAVGRGPGSFTGVRIGIGVAQGLGYAAGLPVIPVSTLATLAQGAADAAAVEWIATAIDARMGEVYWGLYRRGPDGLVTAVGRERVCAPGAVALPEEVEPCYGVGTGWAAHGEALRARLGARLTGVDPAALPHAASMLRLAAAAWTRGQAVPPGRVEPVYLRDRVAQAGGQPP